MRESTGNISITSFKTDGRVAPKDQVLATKLRNAPVRYCTE